MHFFHYVFIASALIGALALGIAWEADQRDRRIFTTVRPRKWERIADPLLSIALGLVLAALAVAYFS